jgi:hypothetical protein
VTADTDGTCTFKDRATLEKSLVALAAGGKTAEHFYRFH